MPDASSFSEIIRWIKDAVSAKKLILEMSYYKVDGGRVRATDGRIVACHPYSGKEEFLVPGADFERLIGRLGDGVKIEVDDARGEVVLKSGRSRGTIKTKSLDDWDYPGIDEEDWKPIPRGMIDALRKLTPFVSENANHIWAMGIALENGWAFATNNVALAGVQCPGLGEIHAILPIWAVDFIVDREKGLKQWCHTPNYLAFRWDNGAWMRSSLIDSDFPEQVSDMVKRAIQEDPYVEITDEFKEAFFRVADLAETSVKVTGEEISASFGNSIITESVATEELGGMETYWGAKYLLPVVKMATYWDPQMWPKPAPFQGDGIIGYVVGARQ
jgi:DNA polymerase III sliding clamp (beta) subunit (PCNA family)